MNLYWLQAGGCGGDSLSMLNMDSPEFFELIAAGGIEILWHPSMSNQSAVVHGKLLQDLLAGRQALDIFCVEGFVVAGPQGTGRFDLLEAQPKLEIVRRLAERAKVVVAVGTCAAFGGVGNIGVVEASGLQFSGSDRGGVLGNDFLSGLGVPVINLPGCPTHYAVLADVLLSITEGQLPELNEYQAPRQWFEILVHQGCLRNEYHEFRVEERNFGERGCLFFYRGCRGPLTSGPCNKVLWNRRSSKTNVGSPCVGCTSPDFPQSTPFFQTPNIADVPLELPAGVDRAHYLAYKGMAAAAAPERLKKRRNLV